MPSIVTIHGEAADVAPIQPVDLIGQGLRAYAEENAGRQRRLRRKQSAAFMMTQVNNWSITDTALALGYSRPGVGMAVEKVRAWLIDWWAAQAPERTAADLAEDEDLDDSLLAADSLAA